MSVRVHAPDGAIGQAMVVLAATPRSLSAAKLAILDNGKPGALPMLERAAEQIAERTGATLLGSRRKGTAATPCDEVLLAEIAAEADLVLTGTAD